MKYLQACQHRALEELQSARCEMELATKLWGIINSYGMEGGQQQTSKNSGCCFQSVLQKRQAQDTDKTQSQSCCLWKPTWNSWLPRFQDERQYEILLMCLHIFSLFFHGHVIPLIFFRWDFREGGFSNQVVPSRARLGMSGWTVHNSWHATVTCSSWVLCKLPE